MNPKPGEVVELQIEKLAGMGDGQGELGSKPAFIPFTLPGDFVRARVVRRTTKLYCCELLEVIRPAQDRQEPQCRHFTQCGGCALQHLPDEIYFNFKRKILQDAVSRVGFSARLVEDVFRIGPEKRRRAELKIEVEKDRVRLGFFAARTNKIIEIEHCPVLTPQLQELLPRLRKALELTAPESGVKAAQLSELNTGIDLTIVATKSCQPEGKKILSESLLEHGVARINWRVGRAIHSIAGSVQQQVVFSGQQVSVPPGFFTQATEAGQDFLINKTLETLGRTKKVVDLYAGCGTFSMPLLAKGHEVQAFEGNREMKESLESAMDNPGFTVTGAAFLRDLFRNPLTGEEMRGVEAIVINPPRNGAEPQILEIVKSDVDLVIIISCNPLTLERDMRHLARSGFDLISAKPIDQFHWSRHLESLSVFSRKPVRQNRQE